MITDDPNTVERNHWEINIAELTFSSANSWMIQSPYLDVNYGAGDNLQLKYESGINSVVNTAIPYGGSYSTMGFRYRFINHEETGTAVSTYPQYSFYPSYFGKNSAVNSTATSFFLPVEAAIKLGDYFLVGEIGYNFNSVEENTWQVGVVLNREIQKGWNILGELHAQIPIAFDQSVYILNLGSTFDFNPTYTLLASAGTSFATSPSFWVSYLGIQLHY